MSDIVIVAAARTAVGKFGGSLAKTAAPELGAHVVRGLLAQAGVAGDLVSEVILGQVLTAGAGQNPARQTVIKAGLPQSVPGLTINKVCGSGLKAVMLAAQAIKCGDADIIVAGGRGMKRPENFQLIWDLASVLGAEVGPTRPVVQAGWVELDRQVGQSGKTVRPKLYIAAGISGAIQHRVGMDASDVIIAINSDPNAPIFDFATYGIVGNAMTILPALTEAFRQQLATLKVAV